MLPASLFSECEQHVRLRVEMRSQEEKHATNSPSTWAALLMWPFCAISLTPGLLGAENKETISGVTEGGVRIGREEAALPDTSFDIL